MLKVRKARPSDSTQFLTWRNDPLVVANSLTKGEIRMQDHRRWYDQKLQSDNCALYVVEYAAEPAGQVRFDIVGSEAAINYSLDATFRRRGLSKPSMNQAIAVFFEEHEDVISLVAFVKPDNVASCRVFERLDFEFDGFDRKMQANRYRKCLADSRLNKQTGD